MARAVLAFGPKILHVRTRAFSTAVWPLAPTRFHRIWHASIDLPSRIPTGQSLNFSTKSGQSRNTDLSADRAEAASGDRSVTTSGDVPVTRSLASRTPLPTVDPHSKPDSIPVTSRPPRRPFSASEDTAIIQGIKQGLSRVDIAKSLGRNAGSVSGRIIDVLQHTAEGSHLKSQLVSRPIRPRKAPRPFSASEDAAIIQGIKQGLSYTVIAESLRRNISSVSSRIENFLQHTAEGLHLKRHPDSRPAAPRRAPRSFSASEDAAIIQGVEQGLSRVVIAESLGRSPGTVRARIRRVLQHKPEGSNLKHHVSQPPQLVIPGMTADQVNAFIVKHIEQGAPFNHIARELGTTWSLVRRQYRLLCPESRRAAVAKKDLSLTSQDKQLILHRHAAGFKITQIATELGRSVTLLRHYMKQDPSLQNLGLTSSRRIFTPSEIEAILHHRAQGLKWAQIAALLGRETKVVCRKYMSTTNAKNCAEKIRRRWTPVETDTVLKLHDAGHSYAFIAREMNRSRTAVRDHLANALKRAGRNVLEELQHRKRGDPGRKPGGRSRSGA